MSDSKNATAPRIILLILGIAFGFVLIRSGVSSYDMIRDMFLLKSIHMYGVLGVAVPVSFLAVMIWKKFGGKPVFGSVTEWRVDGLSSDHAIGGLISGAGWALTGACPGPALAILGFGLYSAAFMIVGIFMGTYAYALRESRSA